MSGERGAGWDVLQAFVQASIHKYWLFQLINTHRSMTNALHASECARQ
mgnify:CR=1 FL=1